MRKTVTLWFNDSFDDVRWGMRCLTMHFSCEFGMQILSDWPAPHHTWCVPFEFFSISVSSVPEKLSTSACKLSIFNAVGQSCGLRHFVNMSAA